MEILIAIAVVGGLVWWNTASEHKMDDYMSRGMFHDEKRDPFFVRLWDRIRGRGRSGED